MRAGGEALGIAREIGGGWLSGVGGDGDGGWYFKGGSGLCEGKETGSDLGAPPGTRRRHCGAVADNVRSSPYFRPKPSVFLRGPVVLFPSSFEMHSISLRVFLNSF
jgi:hypothetical protein